VTQSKAGKTRQEVNVSHKTSHARCNLEREKGQPHVFLEFPFAEGPRAAKLCRF
jgi:hypothetical protein